jgi:DNA-binding PadR family transcriptional regulator
VLVVEEGSLYPALQRCSSTAGCRQSGARRAATAARVITRITRAGRKQLEAEEQQYLRVAGAIARVLQAI